MSRGACSADERRGDRGRLRPPPAGPAVGRARSGLFATAYSDPIPSPDGACWPGSPTGTAARSLRRPAAAGRLRRSPNRTGRCPRTASRRAVGRAGDLAGRPTAPGSPASSPRSAASAPACGWSAPDGSEIRDIAPGAAAVTLGSWSPSGRQLGVTVFRRAPATAQACLVDLRDGTLDGARRRPGGPGLRGQRRRPAGGGPARPPRRPPAGAVRPAQRPAHRAAPRRRRERRRRPLRGHRPPALRAHRRRAASGPRCSPSGSTATPSRRCPYVVAGRDDRPRPGGAGPGGGARRAGLERRRAQRGRAARPALRHARAAPRPPGDVVTGAAFTRDGRALLVAERGPDGAAAADPDRRSDDARERPGHPAAPGGPARRRAPRRARAAHFPAEDGLPLSGWLFRPRARSARLPTLLWLHGGPEAQERPIFQPLFQALVAEGVAVFAPNVRGSGGYGRTFAAADDLDRRFVAITDVRAAVDFLVSARAGRPGPDRGVRPLLRRLPDAGRAGLVPRAVRGRGGRVRDLRLRHVLRRRPSRGSPRRPSPSTATRTPTPRCCASCRRSTAWTGSPRRCWWCTARTTPTCRWSRPSRWSTRCASAARRRGSCCSTTRATRCTAPRTGRCSCARWSGGSPRTCWRWASRRPEPSGRRSAAERLHDLPAVLRADDEPVVLAADRAVLRRNTIVAVDRVAARRRRFCAHTRDRPA